MNKTEQEQKQYNSKKVKVLFEIDLQITIATQTF